ncbi:MAG: CHAT domain-containing protein [Thermoanaerobaculia bacterium]|nr:CHAT domain-containing protein [Thermoanaerobaculia bacterium]
MRLRPSIFCLALLALGLGCGPAEPPPAPVEPAVVRRPLALGTHLEWPRASPQTKEYFEVALRAGELLEIVVAQKGADAALRLSDPEGQPIAVFDRPIGRKGEEQLLFHAERGGVYGVDVEIGGVDPQGGLTLEVVTLRPARAEETLAAHTAVALAQAHQLRRDKKLQESAAKYREALVGFRHQADRTAIEATLVWLARVEEESRAWPAVIETLREMAPRLDAEGWLRMARAQAALGDSQGAFESSLRGLDLAREGKDLQNEALALYQMAEPLRLAGQLPAAEWCYERAAVLYRHAERPDSEATAQLGLTSLYVEVEAGELAARTLERATTLADGGAPVEDDYLTLQKAEVARLTGRVEETRRLAEALVAEGSARPKVLDRARILLLQLARDREDWPEAERLARERLAAVTLGTPEAASAEQDLGQILAYRGQTAAAREALERSLAGSRDADPRTRAALLAGLARVDRAEGQLLSAWNRATDALELVEGFRAGAGRAELRLAWTADTQDFYDLAVGLAVDLARSEPTGGFLERALETSERGRARGLLDALEPPGSGLGRRVRLEDLRRDLERRREALIVSGTAAEELADTEAQLTRLLAELEALPAPAIDRLSPPVRRGRELSSRELSSRELPAPLASARALVATGFQVLEYDLGIERSHLFWISSAGTTVFDLPARAELEALARDGQKQLARSTTLTAGDRPAQVLARLGKVLLGPVAGRLGEAPVVVIPDGALWLVPFAALERPDTGRPLVEAQEVLAAPSLTLLSTLRARGGPLPTRPRVAVFADPIFDGSDSRVLPRSTEPTWPDAAGSSWRSAGGALDRLTYSAQEADILRELVPAAQLVVATGADATKARLAALPPGTVDVLHLATHGLFHATEPSLSGLVLSLVDGRGHLQDGVVRAHEIAALRLPARLVVASACATAQGREIRGEGVVSLAHAFFRAGTSRVVVTLWPVDDEATADLMRHFYRALLLERATPAAALRQAQLALRADPRLSAPFYWAGFVLQGEP